MNTQTVKEAKILQTTPVLLTVKSFKSSSVVRLSLKISGKYHECFEAQPIAVRRFLMNKVFPDHSFFFLLVFNEKAHLLKL